MSEWSSSEVVARPKVKDRVSTYEKIVQILVRMREMKNYLGVVAILGGIGKSFVTRMARTFEAISPSLLRLWRR